MRAIQRTVSGIILGAIAFAAPASAATMLTATGTPLSEAIKNNHGLSDDATLLTFSSDPSGYLIDYSSSAVLHYNGNSDGFAFVTGPATGPDAGTGFADLTITPETVTFSAFKFNMKLPASAGGFDPGNGYKTDFTFDTTVFFSGGGSQNFNTDVGSGAGDNRYIIKAGAGQSIDEILFSNLVGTSTSKNDPTFINDFNFSGIRQASFNVTGVISPVPEPATWALFILGFGAVGGMLRMARRRAVPATA